MIGLLSTLSAAFGLILVACASAETGNPEFCDWESEMSRYYTDRAATIDSIYGGTGEQAHVTFEASCMSDGGSFVLDANPSDWDNGAVELTEISNGVLQGEDESGTWTVSRVEGGVEVQLDPKGSWSGRQDLISGEGIRLYPAGFGDFDLIGGGSIPKPEVDRIEWWSCEGAQCRQNPFGNFLLIEERGNLAMIDAGSPADGPAYIINKNTGEILGHCGGLLMAGGNPDRPCSFEYWQREKGQA